ncbi:thioredoxin [Geodermatophilus sp. CPCC 206100]|uniref:thioredoxin n=1 Tax=Geodermatophilus sp. CPCC 206100 TaxID=3020054 RepID=UPI003B0033CD
MATDDLLSAARRLAHWFPADVRAEDRGVADGEAAALWPVSADFSFAGATGWLNSPPLTGADLRGRVVLVDFWTYTCINWLRSWPWIRAWQRSYGGSGLVTIGVHSPEFTFEHDVDDVRDAVRARGIGHPVALDNHVTVWRSFANHFWPATYLVDADGRLRHHSFGEGGYEETESVLRRLLTEAGAADLPPEPVPVEARGVEVAADWDTLRSGETHLGYDRTAGFASSPAVVPGRPYDYTAPARLRLGHWALSGTWTIGSEVAASHGAGGRLVCHSWSRDVHLVVAPEGPGGVRFRVLLDGRPAGSDAGVDVDEDGHGTVLEPRTYNLIRRHGPGTGGTVEVEFLDPGARVHVLTFG